MDTVIVYPEDAVCKWAVEVNGEMFQELVAELKIHGFVYKREPSRWVGSDRKLYSVYRSLQAVDSDFTLDDDIVTLITPVPDTRFVRSAIDHSCFPVPPINDQSKAIKKGLQQNRLLLALEMGLGKTYVMIVILNHLMAARALC